MSGKQLRKDSSSFLRPPRNWINGYHNTDQDSHPNHVHANWAAKLRGEERSKDQHNFRHAMYNPQLLYHQELEPMQPTQSLLQKHIMPSLYLKSSNNSSSELVQNRSIDYERDGAITHKGLYNSKNRARQQRPEHMYRNGQSVSTIPKAITLGSDLINNQTNGVQFTPAPLPFGSIVNKAKKSLPPHAQNQINVLNRDRNVFESRYRNANGMKHKNQAALSLLQGSDNAQQSALEGLLEEHSDKLSHSGHRNSMASLPSVQMPLKNRRSVVQNHLTNEIEKYPETARVSKINSPVDNIMALDGQTRSLERLLSNERAKYHRKL